MSAIKLDHFSGGRNLQENHGAEHLAKILRDLVGDVGLPESVTGITVTTDVATLASAGAVLAVQATTATSAGGKLQVVTGTPAAGEVQVTYSAAGVATLTFAAADVVTVAAVIKMRAPVVTAP